MNKLYINYFIFIFMMTIIFLSILFSFYYLTPNNYILYQYNTLTNKKTYSKKYLIEPSKKIILNYNKYYNKLLRIQNLNIQTTCIILTNNYKSENISIKSDQLLRLNKSDLIIHNNTTDKMFIEIEIYQIESLLN